MYFIIFFIKKMLPKRNIFFFVRCSALLCLLPATTTVAALISIQGCVVLPEYSTVFSHCNGSLTMFHSHSSTATTSEYASSFLFFRSSFSE